MPTPPHAGTTLAADLAEGMRIAVSALRSRVLRTLLTTLGIVIGIVSVTSMFTVINGIEEAFDRSMALIGDDALFVQRTGWFENPTNWRLRNRAPITEDLAPFLARTSETAVAIAPVTGAMHTLARGRDDAPGIGVTATTANYPDTGGAPIGEGRFFSEAEAEAGRAVVVLGLDPAEALFPAEDPVGKTIRIDGRRFEVIGVLARRGSFLGLASGDNDAVVPLTTHRRLFGGDAEVAVKAKLRPGVTVEQGTEELRVLTRRWRGLDPLADDDFAVNDQGQFRDLVGSVQAATYGVGIFLTALSLLVGGIGVMNVMFVSVRERTREIGIRKAIGATRRAILVQFLAEAVLICLLGGVIGVALAALAAVGLNAVFTARLSVGTVALAFGICAVVGVAFGLVPAWQAARARPIEALRYE